MIARAFETFFLLIVAKNNGESNEAYPSPALL